MPVIILFNIHYLFARSSWYLSVLPTRQDSTPGHFLVRVRGGEVAHDPWLVHFWSYAAHKIMRCNVKPCLSLNPTHWHSFCARYVSVKWFRVLRPSTKTSILYNSFFFFLRSIKWFQVLLSNTNNSIYLIKYK